MIQFEYPNLMQVRAFVRVAEQGSVSKASLSLYRAQSVVTRAIADLEQRLKIVLFERHANGMRLSEQGRHILPRAKQALAELEQVSQHLGQRSEPLYLFHTRRLELFIKLCEARHMQTVATAFGLSQPAVSTALKTLEGGCGQALFERTPRGLQPTQASQDILLYIRRALNELRHIDADIAALQGVLKGRVVVGALPLSRTRILPEAIIRMLEAHPEVRIATVESPFDILATELRAGDIDFVLGALRPSEYASDLHGEQLLAENLVLLVRQGHPLLKKTIQPEDLSQAQWILPRSGAPARQQLENYFKNRAMDIPYPAVETGDLAIIRGLLLHSDMLAAVSTQQLEHEIKSGELQPLPIQIEQTSRPIGLIYRSKCLHSPAAEKLMQKIRAVVMDII